MILTTFIVAFAMGPASSGGQRGQEITLAEFVRPIQQVRFRSTGSDDFSSLGSLVYPEFFSAKVYEESKRLEEVRKVITAIKIGTVRLEVEKVFGRRDGGLQIPNTTRYYINPGTLIVLPYDESGGPWSLLNRVKGPIRVYRGNGHVH